MIQGCFSNPGSPVSSSSTSTSKDSLVTCIYQTRLLDSPSHLTLTWSKSPNSHSLTIHAPRLFSLTISLYPSSFSLFRTRPASKSIQIHPSSSSTSKVKLFWDFTRAQFPRPNSAEPDSAFYFAITHNGRLDFFLGDLWTEFSRRGGMSRIQNSPGDSTLLSKREHLFGRRTFSTRAELLGRHRLVDIECAGGVLKVKIDGETKLTIKRLAWKFRGNERIMIDGVGVEFYWDVFNWVSNGGNPPIARKKGGNGVFVLQVGEGGVWPEMVGPEKRLMSKSSPAPAFSVASSPSGSCSSVLQWAEESSDCGRSSSGSSSTTASGGGGGFSLVLYAWRKPFSSKTCFKMERAMVSVS